VSALMTATPASMMIGIAAGVTVAAVEMIGFVCNKYVD